METRDVTAKRQHAAIEFTRDLPQREIARIRQRSFGRLRDRPLLLRSLRLAARREVTFVKS
jgi:hypothetical protein